MVDTRTNAPVWRVLQAYFDSYHRSSAFAVFGSSRLVAIRVRHISFTFSRAKRGDEDQNNAERIVTFGPGLKIDAGLFHVAVDTCDGCEVG